MNDLKRRVVVKGVKKGDLEEQQLLIDTIRASECMSRQQPTKSDDDIVVSMKLKVISNSMPTAADLLPSSVTMKGGDDDMSSSVMECKVSGCSVTGSSTNLNDYITATNNNNNYCGSYDCSHGHDNVYSYPQKDDIDNTRFHGSISHSYGNNHGNSDYDASLSEGGKWHRLPYEMVDYILIFLGDVDMIGYLLIASRHTFQPSEKVYEYLCSIIYLQQTSRKLLQVCKWGNSWRRMLYHRPRLRTNGLYALRTQYTKEHNNDRFWEEKDHRSVEVRFYRCFRFMDHNRVLYSLDVMEVEDMAKLMQLSTARPKQIFEGHYTVQGREVVVDVSSVLLLITAFVVSLIPAYIMLIKCIIIDILYMVST